MKTAEMHITFRGASDEIEKLHQNMMQLQCKDVVMAVNDVQDDDVNGKYFEITAHPNTHIHVWKTIVLSVFPSVEIFFVRWDTVRGVFQTNDTSHEFYAFDYFVDCKIDDGIKAELYDMDSGPYSKQDLIRELKEIYGDDEFETLLELVERTNDLYLGEDDYIIISEFEVVEL